MKFLKYEVSIVKPESSILKPENATKPRVLSCSVCDRIVNPTHVRKVLFFGPGAQKDVAAVLKSALSKVLVPFYSQAGRVRRKDDKSGKLEIVCNDEGAVFIEASVDMCIADFGGFEPNPLFEHLGPTPDYSTPFDERPVVHAQVTTFKCGGFSIGLAMHHTVSDASGANQFIVSWGEVACGKPISILPRFDSSPLNANGTGVPKLAPEELTMRPKTVQPVDPKGGFAQRLFSFMPEQLKELKDEANSGLKDGWTAGRPFSTFETLSAHAWRCLNRAKTLEASDTVRFFTSLDIRKRVKGNLPDGYCRNAVMFTSVATTSGELLRNPLSFSAKLVRQAVWKMTTEYINSVIAWVEHQTDDVKINLNPDGKDIFSVSWLRMPSFESDFGSGKPLFVGPIGQAPNPALAPVIMLPGYNGPGSINLLISLRTEHMMKLEADPTFLGGHHAEQMMKLEADVPTSLGGHQNGFKLGVET